MNGLTTIGDNKDAASALPRLYLRPDEAARVIGVSRRTLASWQATRVIGFRRVGRTILFSVADIQAALDRYRIAPIGEAPRRKRRMQHITPEPTTK
jgi:excisionase family DNA binding protein